MKYAMIFVQLLLCLVVSSGVQAQNYLNDFMNGYNFTRGNDRQEELLEMRRRELEIQQRQLQMQQDAEHREQQRYERETKQSSYDSNQIDQLQVESFYREHPQYNQGELSKKLIETSVSLKQQPQYKYKSPYDILIAAHEQIEQSKKDQEIWRKEQEAFFLKHPEYKNSPLRWNALNTVVIKLANAPENASKTGAEILEAAHTEVQNMK